MVRCTLFASLIMGLCSISQASIVGVTISTDGPVNNGFTGSLGYSFSVDTAHNVVSLGVWDHLGDGLINSHQVGLWNSSGTLLASTTVGSGTSGILDSGFRFNDIASVALNAGEEYYVAATFNDSGDYWTADPTTLDTAPGLTYLTRRYQSGSGLLFPVFVGSNGTGYWGGNIRLASATVPEPSTCTLFAGLIACFGLAGRRRKRKQSV